MPACSLAIGPREEWGPLGEAAAAANVQRTHSVSHRSSGSRGCLPALQVGRGLVGGPAPPSAGPFLCSRGRCEEHRAFNTCQVPAHRKKLSQQKWRLPFSSANRPANVNSAGFRSGSFLCPRRAGPCGEEMLRQRPSLCWQPVPAEHDGLVLPWAQQLPSAPGPR